MGLDTPADLSGTLAPPPLPTAAAGAPADGSSSAAAASPILVCKVLTYSDVSTDVARTGRIVLPRIQVQQCLPELLRLCRADRGLPAGAVVGGSSGAVKLSVNLEVVDEAGRTWVLLLKTWQNVVGGEHRPTFVLENTAEFVRANRLVQGGTLAFCPAGGRMLLRTTLRTDQLLPGTLKRGAAAKRRGPLNPTPAGWGAPATEDAAAAAVGAAAGRGRQKRKAAAAGLAGGAYEWSAATVTPDVAEAAKEATGNWPSQPHHSQAAQAAEALLQMLCGGASPISTQSGPQPLSTDGGAAIPTPLSATPAPAPERGASPTRHIYRPQAVHGSSSSGAASPCGSALLARVQQAQQLQHYHEQQQQDRACSAAAVLQQAAAVLSASTQQRWQESQHQQQQQQIQAPAPAPAPVQPHPLSGPFQQYATAAGAAAGQPSDALVQAQAWLAAILEQKVQQQRERRLAERYNQLLLQLQLQALQQEQEQQYAAALAAAAAQGTSAALPAAPSAAGPPGTSQALQHLIGEQVRA